jgi:hypothetical protein
VKAARNGLYTAGGYATNLLILGGKMMTKSSMNTKSSPERNKWGIEGIGHHVREEPKDVRKTDLQLQVCLLPSN